MTGLLITAAFCFGQASSPTVGFVLEVDGDFSVLREGKPVDVDEGDTLRDGDQIKVSTGGIVKVYFRPNGPVATLNGPAEAVVKPGKLEGSESVSTQASPLPGRTAENLDQKMTGSKIGGYTLRTTAKFPPPPVTPVPGTTIREALPKFSWPADSDVTAYSIEIFIGPAGKRERVVHKQEVDKPHFEYPEDARKLERGQPYLWRVVGKTSTGKAKSILSTGEFQIIEEKLEAELDEIAKLAKSQQPSDWLLAAQAYSAIGLYDEPLALYNRYVEKKPKAKGVWKLIAERYESAGKMDEAKKAREHAGEEK